MSPLFCSHSSKEVLHGKLLQAQEKFPCRRRREPSSIMVVGPRAICRRLPHTKCSHILWNASRTLSTKVLENFITRVYNSYKRSDRTNVIWRTKLYGHRCTRVQTLLIEAALLPSGDMKVYQAQKICAAIGSVVKCSVLCHVFYICNVNLLPMFVFNPFYVNLRYKRDTLQTRCVTVGKWGITHGVQPVRTTVLQAMLWEARPY